MSESTNKKQGVTDCTHYKHDTMVDQQVESFLRVQVRAQFESGCVCREGVVFGR